MSDHLRAQITGLYRFFDAADMLLYVGITNSLTRRLDRHNVDRPWYHEVARVSVEHHPDRAAALAAEKAAIEAERPKYNVKHNLVHLRPTRRATKKASTNGTWIFESHRSGFRRQCDLILYPELECSSVVDDFYELDGEGQLEEYVQYMKRKYPETLEADAVPIYWSVHSRTGGVFEHAPFHDDPIFAEDFLTYFTWPVNAKTGERLDWFALPVVNDRFPEFAKALDWTPSPLQKTCPLRSILQSRAGWRPTPTRSYQRGEIA